MSCMASNVAQIFHIKYYYHNHKGKVMLGMRIVVCIPTDKRHEFFQSVSSLSPEKPISLFHVHEDITDKRLLNLTAKCSNIEPMTSYLLSERFKALLGAINALGSLEEIRMDKSIQASLKDRTLS